MNAYNLKEGDILKIGRIAIRIRAINFKKNNENKITDKNIKVIDFSLSKESIKGKAFLSIDVDSLDDKNKILANVYAQRNMIKIENVDGENIATFSVNVDDSMDTEELSKTLEKSIEELKHPNFLRSKNDHSNS